MNPPLDIGRRNIVVIGTSAGGVEALRTMFARLPSDSSASFFVVLHMPAHSPSQLDRVLQAVTPMRVQFARDEELILPNMVYVAPPIAISWSSKTGYGSPGGRGNAVRGPRSMYCSARQH